MEAEIVDEASEQAYVRGVEAVDELDGRTRPWMRRCEERVPRA